MFSIKAHSIADFQRSNYLQSLKRVLLFILALLWCCTPTVAKSTIKTDELLMQKVYADLKAIIGDQRVVWPDLKVWEINERVATFFPDDHTIYIDQKALEVCRSLGMQKTAALAYIIGHEITHFYQKHLSPKPGSPSFFMMNTGDFQSRRQEEAQADTYGSFIAYQAGYPVLEVIPDLLDALYKEYAFSTNETPDYPALADRKTLAREARVLAADLISSYQMANYLSITGQFEAAYQIYDFVGQHISFRQLFNNLGVSSLSAFIRWQKYPYQYPIEINTDIPLERSRIFGSPSMMLQAAQRNFESALSFDANYPEARIHQLIVFDLAEQDQQAISLIQKMERTQFSIHQKVRFYLAAGNFYARRSQNTSAEQYYQRILKQKVAPLYKEKAKANLKVLKKGSDLFPAQEHLMPVKKSLPPIGGIQLHQFTTFNHTYALAADTQLNTAEKKGLAVLQFQTPGQTFKLQWIYGDQINLGKIKTNQSIEVIKEEFPKAFIKIISHQKGQFLYLPVYGLIINTNQNGLITDWGYLIWQ